MKNWHFVVCIILAVALPAGVALYLTGARIEKPKAADPMDGYLTSEGRDAQGAHHFSGSEDQHYTRLRARLGGIENGLPYGVLKFRDGDVVCYGTVSGAISCLLMPVRK